MKEEKKRYVKRFSSFEEADRADIEHYRNLSKEEKLEELTWLLNQGPLHFNEPRTGSPPRLERVYRIVKFEEH